MPRRVVRGRCLLIAALATAFTPTLAASAGRALLDGAGFFAIADHARHHHLFDLAAVSGGRQGARIAFPALAPATATFAVAWRARFARRLGVACFAWLAAFAFSARFSALTFGTTFAPFAASAAT
ncbi:MAG: hypothetical protein Q7T55_11985, partial [Solirubrobacteraceae bacterium]|nr:hypothetical protein [Solirubrobacteraceae bacterium]